MDQAALDYLHNQDWHAIAAKVANYARRLSVSMYGWSQNEMLPKGFTAEDLALSAIEEFWKSPSRINQDYPLVVQLCGVVKHKLWNLSKSKESQTTSRHQPQEADLWGWAEQAPDNRHEIRELFRRVIGHLKSHPKVVGKKEHLGVIEALEEGAFSPTELESVSGIPRPRIYQIQRELSSIYPEIREILKSEGVESI